jgi:hypothetical protein
VVVKMRQEMPTGTGNVFLGNQSGYGCITGNNNTYLGLVSGSNATGSENTFVGLASGVSSTGSHNVFLGPSAGALEKGSNRLFIANSGADSSSALIYGEFVNKLLVFNAKVGIGTTIPTATLQIVNPGFAATTIIGGTVVGNTELTLGTSANVNGYCYIQSVKSFGSTNGDLIINNSGGNVGIGTTSPGYKLQVGIAGDGSQARANAWNVLSDIRLKSDFVKIIDPLGIISSLRGFYYNWNIGTDKSRQLGLSAQDVEKVLPEIVSEGSDGYLSVEYSKLTPVLIEAIKEQQQQIESTKQENQQLKSELEVIKEKMERIEALLAQGETK